MLCCSLPQNAAQILDLNGRTKIKLIGDTTLGDGNPALVTKWTRQEIADFIELKYGMNGGDAFERLVEFGTVAGCPEYVKTLIESGEVDAAVTPADLEKKLEGAARWAARWTVGAATIQDCA